MERVWEGQEFLLRQAGFYSYPIEVQRGCTQGDTNSPIIFNLIIDAVVQKWKSKTEGKGGRASFYADDGLIENTDPKKLQKGLDEMIGLFEQFGLQTNEKKFKVMIYS